LNFKLIFIISFVNIFINNMGYNYCQNSLFINLLLSTFKRHTLTETNKKQPIP